MTEAALAGKGLARGFGRWKPVLKGLSFEIAKGEVVALLGANGSGKTTLLRVLAGLLEPDEGNAWVFGRSLVREPLAARASLGWVPAVDGGFFPRLTGRENLEVFAALMKVPRSRVDETVSGALATPALAQALGTPFFSCSAGMKQGLAVCRALLRDPPILLLDEPTRSLDDASGGMVRAFLRECRGRRTVLFATHSKEEAGECATRTLTLAGGTLA
jgi:ABC-2 type transport system ATP-binding protein